VEKEISVDCCSVEGCYKKKWSRGLCGNHYSEFRRNGCIKGITSLDPHTTRKSNIGRPLVGLKQCSVVGCNNFSVCRNLCAKHVHQFYRHGKIVSRLELVQNKIEQYKEIAKIYFNNSSKFTLIDVDLVPKASQQVWYLDKQTGYALSNGRIRKLHHLVLSPKNGLFVDHRNRNTLDNRKINLRYATPSQSSMNSKKPTHNLSGVKGLSFIPSQFIWQARIRLNKKAYVKKSIHREVCESWLKEMRPKLHGKFACEG